jgi:hypothetical protein
MSLTKAKLQKLIEIGGFADDLALYQASLADAVCPAICMNEDCSYTEDLEKDQEEGWCPECNTNSMKSCLILAGII